MTIRTALAALAGATLAGAALAGATLAAGAALAAVPTYAVVGSVAGNDGGWDYTSFDPALRRVYLAHADAAFALDVDSGKITAKLADTPHPHQVVPLPGGDTILVTVGGDNTARFIDAKTGALKGQVATGLGPDAALYDARSGLVIVADHKGGDVLLIDPKTMKAAGSIAVGGALEYLAVDGSGRVFVNVEDKNELVAIDLATKTVATRLALPGCDGPTGLIYAPGAGALIAACDGKAAVIDAKTMTVSAMLDIGKGPDAVLYDDVRKLAFIPCGQSAELDVISVAAPGQVAVVSKVKTEKGARTGTVDPQTGKIYLPAARYGAPAAGGQRPPMIPGSFHLIVVAPGA
jgi:DNA-binding beta-propeller fold protein YncE